MSGVGAFHYERKELLSPKAPHPGILIPRYIFLRKTLRVNGVGAFHYKRKELLPSKAPHPGILIPRYIFLRKTLGMSGGGEQAG
ncbi:TPA: hypothetical protein DEG75_00280 [Candidatus Dependentiae bacterium]|nr:hypothetical protein [Candidatus Dependentiae bacterium]